MNVLFLCLSKVWNINDREIYQDLLREFIKDNNNVYVVTPVERRFNEKTCLIRQGSATILKVKTLNIQKTGFIEKGLGTVLLERQYLSAIKKYFKGIHFDLVLYATPPITLVKPIKYIKKKYHSYTYLLLKDIFPQNAVDLNMMDTHGIKGLLYKFFRYKEKQLYFISDRIGCMSRANVEYLLMHNPQINPQTVEVCPNSSEFFDFVLDNDDKITMRNKYGIPTDKKIFVYGGNLGKPQGISFLIECLRKEKDNNQVHFLIVGDGTEYGKIEAYIENDTPKNVSLLKRLPKDDFDKMIASCDVGLIFLDHRFTIPNFPSRLLSYMQAGLPVLACTDPNTDIGKVIVDGGFGWWCESNSTDEFSTCVERALCESSDEMISREFAYFKKHYCVDVVYKKIFADLNQH